MSTPDTYPSSREESQGTGPFPPRVELTEENVLDHHLEEYRSHLLEAQALRRQRVEAEDLMTTDTPEQTGIDAE